MSMRSKVGLYACVPVPTFHVGRLTRRLVLALIVASLDLSVAAGDAPAAVPTIVETQPASEVEYTSAKLHAIVNPGGSHVTDCEFEYAEIVPNSGSPSSVPCSPSPGSGVGPVAVTASLASLKQGTTYQFRIHATNAAATSLSPFDTFKTRENVSIIAKSPAARSIQVRFTNKSDSKLKLVKSQLDHGCWAEESTVSYAPPPEISREQSILIESESCGILTGTEFHVAYQLHDGEEMEMIYDNPYAGSNSYNEVTPKGYTFTRTGGGGNNAELTVTFSGCSSSVCDGIPEEWKRHGVTIDPGTGLPAAPGKPGEFIDLPHMGVSLDRPTLMVQWDWMEDATHNQQLEQGAIDRVIKAFNEDPVTYPGASRSGITLVVDNGPGSTISPGGAKWGSLSKAKAIPWKEYLGDKTTNLVEAFQNLIKTNLDTTGRGPIFHYAVAAYHRDEASGNSSGVAPIDGGLVVSLGGWPNDHGNTSEQAGSFMHEFGHVLGLGHGGEDGENYKPNYPSIMNYAYDFAGVLRNGERVVDYSREPEPNLDEMQLTEKGGMSLGANPQHYGITWQCPDGSSKSNSVLTEVDWNCDGVTGNGGTGFDVNGAQFNGSPVLQVLNGNREADWNRVHFLSGGIERAGGTAAPLTSAEVAELEDHIDPTRAMAAQARIRPLLTYTGAVSGHYHDLFTATATLVDPTSNTPPLSGKTITFQLGAADSCTAVTNATGVAACTIRPTQAANQYEITTSFAGDETYQPGSDTHAFMITPEETTLSYTGASAILAGASYATLAAKLVEDGTAETDGDAGAPAPMPSETVTLAIRSQKCTGTTDASGNVSCTIPSITTPLGSEPVEASFAGDSYYAASKDKKEAVVFAFPSHGAFTLGDASVASASTNTKVTWWAQAWRNLNSLSGGPAPAAFKGFAGNITLPTTTPATKCDPSWTTKAGNSATPTSVVPSYMGVVVTSKVTKPNATISGNTVSIVVVRTNPGYAPKPSHQGTGVIVGKYC
jgi:hypothetical protein